MAPVLVRHVAPGVVARLAGTGNQVRAPQLAAGARIVGRDDARLGSGLRHAAAPGNDLAVGDDRSGGLVGRVRLVVENPGLPHLAPGSRLKTNDVVVRRRVDDQIVVDGNVAIGGIDLDELPDIGGKRPPMLPQQVARHRVDRLDDVVRVRHVHHAVVDQRRSLLAAVRQGAGPDHPQVRHIVPVDPIQRAVAPAVRCPPPREPVGGIRFVEHRVGDGQEPAVGLGKRVTRNAEEHAEHGYPPDGLHIPPRRKSVFKPDSLAASNPSQGSARTSPATADNCASIRLRRKMEAPPGFEPGMEVLQTSALPLGDGATGSTQPE